MHAPFLTIIIPTFRAEKTLQASLDSVLQQDFRDLEVLIMDGGSSDGTAAIAQKAAAQDARVRFLSEPDKGVYDAMNKGISQARGTWIYFLGSDDFLYDPTVLTKIFTAPGHSATDSSRSIPGPLDSHDDADFLYGNVVSPSYKGEYDGEFGLAKLLSRNISHQAIFYRRTLFDIHPAYNLRYKGYADWDLNIRLFLDNGVRIRYIGGIIARFGPDGLSSRHDTPFLREVLFPERLRLLQQTGLRTLRPILAYDEWWRLLRNAEFPGRTALETYAASLTGTTTPALPPGAALPRPIARMASWQEKLPRGLLKIGICSKIIMFASYLSNLLTGSLK